jgi:hypothetical protein
MQKKKKSFSLVHFYLNSIYLRLLYAKLSVTVILNIIANSDCSMLGIADPTSQETQSDGTGSFQAFGIMVPRVISIVRLTSHHQSQ